jgi:hypothetical protein
MNRCCVSSVSVVDWINSVAPHNGGITEKNVHEFSWPPRPVFDVYWWWCRVADPVLLYNPLWIKYLSMLSPFVFAPFYLVAIYAIITRREWIRIPIIIYSSILFVDLSAFFVEAIWGDLPSPNMWIFTAGYGTSKLHASCVVCFDAGANHSDLITSLACNAFAGYYQFFPLIAIYRFWSDHPFTVDPPCRGRVKGL